MFPIYIKPNYFKKETMLHDQILQLQMNLDLAKEHIKELEAGKKAGAPKARSALQKVKVLAHELRKACITTQKAIPVKSRAKVNPTEPVAGRPAVAEVVAEIPAETIAEPPIKKPRKTKSKKQTSTD